MIVAATGHRPDKLGGYSDDIALRLGVIANRWLLEQNYIDYAISGMALGWDQAVAHQCITLGIPFDAYIPFKGQEQRWPQSAKNHYEYLLAMARRVKVVSEGGFAGWKMQARNEAMVDTCTHVLALWNGSASGTGNCILYAQTQMKPISNMWSRFKGQP